MSSLALIDLMLCVNDHRNGEFTGRLRELSIGDDPDTLNNTIRRVSSNGMISTYAGNSVPGNGGDGSAPDRPAADDAPLYIRPPPWCI